MAGRRARPAADGPRGLDAALLEIERRFGKGTVQDMDDRVSEQVPAISTGSIQLDDALGVAGLPLGRIIEIYGPESSGKTGVALQAAASAQRAGGKVAFIDVEHALDKGYARRLGVDTKTMKVSQPDSAEQALEIADMLIRSGGVMLVIIDSVSALVPQVEIDGDMGDAHVGLQARLMSQALRKMTGAAHQTNTMVIFINQLREKVGVLFGSPETTSGGKALKFYATVRLDVRRIDTIKDGPKPIGIRQRIKVAKNKVSPPFGVVEVDFLWSCGFDRLGQLVDLGTEQGIMLKSGAWYTYDGDQVGQGKPNARRFLRRNPGVADEIEKKIRAALAAASAEEEAEAEQDGPLADEDDPLDG